MFNEPLLFQRLPWYTRFPVKVGIFALTVFAISFPNPKLLIRHWRHWQNPNALIEPNSPAIDPLFEELKPQLLDAATPGKVLNLVERYVYQRIPYRWDWENWGNSDYLPTVTEIIEKGHEDCDGRALIAASLIRRLGYDAKLVADFAHVWVETNEGEFMGPRKAKAVVATDEGLVVQKGASFQLLGTLPYGLAVFPLGRELIGLLVFWLLILPRNVGLGRCSVGLVLLVNGLLFVRVSSLVDTRPVLWGQWVGIANALAGIMTVLIGSSLRNRRSRLGRQ